MFFPLWDIWFNGITIEFSFKIEWVRPIWKSGSNLPASKQKGWKWKMQPLARKFIFARKLGICFPFSNSSLHFETKINCNTTRQNVDRNEKIKISQCFNSPRYSHCLQSSLFPFQLARIKTYHFHCYHNREQWQRSLSHSHFLCLNLLLVCCSY